MKSSEFIILAASFASSNAFIATPSSIISKRYASFQNSDLSVATPAIQQFATDESLSDEQIDTNESNLNQIDTNESNLDQIDFEDTPLIQRVNKDIAHAQKKQQKYNSKVNNYTSKIASLEQQKNDYLDQNNVHKVFTESKRRSAAKALIWRIMACSITFMTTLKFSQDIGSAAKVVGSTFVPKVLAIFFGERLMNKNTFGREGGADSVGRSVAKAMIWRFLAICNTLTVCFFFTKDFSTASKVAGSDAIFKSFLMVAYERVWAKIEWGKDFSMSTSQWYERPLMMQNANNTIPPSK